MGNPLSAVLAEIIHAAPSLHRAGTFSSRALEAIFEHASQRTISHSAETGSGASTLLFSHLSDHHLVFAVDDGTESIRAVRTSRLLRPGVVTFIEGPTQLTLPVHRFDASLQLVLIDGPHGYPFPDLEYYYFYQRLDEDGLLIVDDIQIRSVNNLYEFLRADDMFRLMEVVENTAFFRRTAAPTFSPVGDGWWTQGYNRRDFETTTVEPGETETLERLVSPTPFFLDYLGSVQDPARSAAVEVPASEPLVVAGWAIDERSRHPAAWIEIVLDGIPYRTEARVPRSDVAAAHGNIQYLRCGFLASLPADRLSPGSHAVKLRIVLKGGHTYYQTPEVSFTAR
ncbi:MAG: class I SAM-dependent methyltransferase [Vicinamibacterales bacterium]|nr:class I SAM-dependent methyltransferase [Vicinamibacterales bacterium]